MTILTASDLSYLDNSLWWWEFGEYVSEGIVILGCAGEFVAEFTNRLTDGDEARKHRLSKASLLILIAGLATGLACLMGATVVSGRIIASLNEEAGQARLDAGHANERAASAELQTTELRVAMADRNISPEQQRKIREACLASPWKGRDVWVRSYPNDGEAERLIVELMAAFTPCLTFEDRTGQASGSGTVVGIRVDPGPDRRFAEFLIKTLSDKNAGDLSVDGLTPFGGGETTEIMVGLKPAALTKAVAANLNELGPRRITKEQHDRIVTSLSKFAGTPMFIAALVTGTADEIKESKEYACGLSKTFEDAHIDAPVLQMPAQYWTKQGVWLDVMPASADEPIDPSGPVARASIEISRVLNAESVLSPEPLFVPLPKEMMGGTDCGKKAVPSKPTAHIRLVISKTPPTILR